MVREAPGVDDVAVFGTDDEDWGQRVCAAVVGSASVADLDALARVLARPGQAPKTWVHVEGLPLTATGKVRRDRLPDLLGD